MEYIDIHSHLNFTDFDEDREAIISSMVEKKIGTIIVGTNFEDSKKAVEIANKNKDIWAIVGCHPINAKEGFDYDSYKALAKNEKVVGIGECGFDYVYKNDMQAEVFDKQIQLANEINKPLMLHIRNAYKDAYEMVKDRAKVIGNAHFFAGGVEDAKNFLDIGFYISFTGVITFTNDYNEVLRFVPDDRINSETDSPFVSPVPNRGKRNNPTNVIDIVAKMAEIRGNSFIHMKSTVLGSANKLFINNS